MAEGKNELSLKHRHSESIWLGSDRTSQKRRALRIAHASWTPLGTCILTIAQRDDRPYLLECQLHRELRGTRSADLVEGVEAAKTAVQHLIRKAKRGIRQRTLAVSEVRCIQDVEKLGTYLEPNAGPQGEVPAQRQIGLPCTESSNCAA
jgi:hypothetical protein